MVTDDRLAAFARRLNEALDDKGYPPKGGGRQVALGKRYGLSQKGVRKWLEGEGWPTTQRLAQLAHDLEVSFEWLVSGTGSKRVQGIVDASRLVHDVTTEAFPTARQIPVISYVQAGDPRPVMDEYMAGDGFRTISLEGDIADQVGPYTFALQISGESMADEFQDGDTVVVDPDAPVRPGDVVVAKLEHDEAATIKKYRERGYDENSKPIIELKPLNEDYAPVTMDARNPGTIIGPVVEHRRRLRR